MVATPFKLQVTMRNRNGGGTQRETVTMSDVNGALGSFKSTTNNFATVRGKPGDIVDIIDLAVNQAGVDTSEIQIWLSGKDSGEAVESAAIVNTINNRLPGGVALVAGSTLQFKQIT